MESRARSLRNIARARALIPTFGANGNDGRVNDAERSIDAGEGAAEAAAGDAASIARQTDVVVVVVVERREVGRIEAEQFGVSEILAASKSTGAAPLLLQMLDGGNVRLIQRTIPARGGGGRGGGGRGGGR